VVESTREVFAAKPFALWEEIRECWDSFDRARLFACFHLSNDACCQLAQVPSVRIALAGSFPSAATCDHALACRRIVSDIVTPILESVESLRGQLELTSRFKPSRDVLQIELLLDVLLKSLHTPLHIPYPGTPLTYSSQPPTTPAHHSSERVTSFLGFTCVPTPSQPQCTPHGDDGGVFTRFDTALEKLACCEGNLRRLNSIQANICEDHVLAEMLPSQSPPNKHLTFLLSLKKEMREFVANYDNPTAHTTGQAHSGSLRALVAIIDHTRINNVFNIRKPIVDSLKDILSIRVSLQEP